MRLPPPIEYAMPIQGEVTRLLSAANRGDHDALNDVVALVYDELRRMARRQLASEHPGHTLESGALVHEGYLRLIGLDRIEWRDRHHFLAMASRMMRRVLIDHAIRRRTRKRGSAIIPVPLDMDVPADARSDDLLALDEALLRLEQLDPRQARIVECRFFGGMSVEETAAVLDLSPATVKRDWTAARAWLNRELGT
jgi:RNA polymerase sigma factor (TIGR02999 family)